MNLLQMQACLKEIHAKMLRKHLQRLEQPLEDEDKLEDAHVMKSEEDIEDYVKGINFLLFFDYLRNMKLFCGLSPSQISN